MQKPSREETVFFYEVYLLDPEIAVKRVGKKAEEDRDDTQKGCFTDDEIASFNWIFPHVSEYSSLKQACVQDLLEREHEDENLAKLGINQYCLEHCKTFSSSSKERELELEEKVDDVSQADFEEIRKKLKGATAQKMICLQKARKSRFAPTMSRTTRTSERSSQASSPKSLQNCQL